MNQFFEDIDKLFVINLEHDLNRKKHVTEQFSNLKISNFEFIDAVTHKDQIVKNEYIENVVSFPPCFRCGREKCSHENNFITPKQVANFLSMKKIMEIIVMENYKNVLIFEDDFVFKAFFKRSYMHFRDFWIKNKLADLNSPLLIRIGSHTRVNKKYYLKFLFLNKSTFLEDNVENMANPCFLINNLFAKHFLDNFKKIETTSDNFIHRKLCEKNNVRNFSIYPFPINQLSYGNKENKFVSTISETNTHHKNNFDEIQRVNDSSEYKNLKENWLNQN